MKQTSLLNANVLGYQFQTLGFVFIYLVFVEYWDVSDFFLQVGQVVIWSLPNIRLELPLIKSNYVFTLVNIYKNMYIKIFKNVNYVLLLCENNGLSYMQK